MGLSCEPCINGKNYLGTNLNLDNNQAILLSVAGGVLWLTTLLLSAILGATKSLYEGQFQGYYFVVFAFTLITAFSALFDYNLNRKNCSTCVTVFLGSMATFFSLGLWAADDLKTYSTALVFVQCSANALQLAAIFNDGRIPAENIRENENVSIEEAPTKPSL